MAMTPKKKDPVADMFKGAKRGAGDPNYAKKMTESAPKKPTGTNKKNPAKPVVKATSNTTVKPKGTPAKKPTVPPDYDVIIPGYNDRATVNRLNKEAAAKAAKKKKGM